MVSNLSFASESSQEVKELSRPTVAKELSH